MHKEIFPGKPNLDAVIVFKQMPIFFYKEHDKYKFQLNHHGRVHIIDSLMKFFKEHDPDFLKISKERNLSGEASVREVTDNKDNDKFLETVLTMCSKASRNEDGFTTHHSDNAQQNLQDLIDRIDLHLYSGPSATIKI